jgi:hypothetical protein
VCCQLRCDDILYEYTDHDTPSPSNINMIPFIQKKGTTTSASKRGQVLGYAALTGDRKMKLKEIVALTGVPKSTCSDLINKAKQRSLETGDPDLCSQQNLAPDPTSKKGRNKVLTAEEERRLIAITLSDATHCRMPLRELAAEGIVPTSIKPDNDILVTVLILE